MCTSHPILTIEDPVGRAISAEEEDFSERLIATVNDATTALMISIGHRTGLFEALKKGPVTSAGLAARAGLDERYVREWLGALASAKIVAFDPAGRLFTLPEAHGAFLGRDATNGNMAAMFQYIAVLGQVESRIVDCFQNGGGVPYEAYDRFHEVMAEESNQTVVAALEEAILPLVPGLRDRLAAGISVADIGCGSGRAMNHLAASFPNSRFTGYDLSGEAIANARAEATRLGLDNVAFHVVDATHLPADSGFDLIFTFDAVHDQADPAAVLRQIRERLNPGGVYVMQDIDSATDLAENLERPLAPFIYAISCMHCMTVSLAQGGAGLGAAWGEDLALTMLADAGFTDVKTDRLEHDIMNLYYICR